MELTPRRIKKGWMNLRVSRIHADNHNTRTLFLEDNEEGGRVFDYTAGQYLTFRFDHLSEKPVVRSYTMSSSPRRMQDSAITVKEVDDGFVSRFLCRETQVGDILRARGPIGKFCFDPKLDHPHLVMVAAGSGVTPFISIMYQELPFLGQPGHPESLALLVSYRSMDDLICWEAIEELRQHPRVRILVSLSRAQEIPEGFVRGRVDEDKIHSLVQGDYSHRTYMTCGPEEMMALTVHHLRAHGVLESAIKTESFAS